MDKSPLLLVVLTMSIACMVAVFAISPLSESAASSEPLAHNEAPLQERAETSDILFFNDPLEFTPAYTITLPTILKGYRYRRPCSLESPFSIEIAAIHQVVPDEAWDSPERALAEAEWLERIEEGYPALVEALADSGACWTRVEVKWSDIQPEPPPAPYNFAFYDGRLQVLAESGVQILALVHGVPYWAGEHGNGPIYPERIDDFAQFLTDLVNRYKEPPYNVLHWELINEPDQTGWAGLPSGYGYYGDQYAEMLAQAYPAIKAADPSATVLMGGVAYDWFEEYGDDGGPFNRYFPDDVMAGGGGGFLDATNFHYFPDFFREWEQWNTNPPPTCGLVYDGMDTPYEAGGIDVIAKTNHFRNRLRVCFGVDRPIWITEFAEHGYAGDLSSLGQQARYVLQGYARALAVGVQNITWFALVSPPYEGGSRQQGLLYEEDWSPKPAFYTYQTLTNELFGYQYSHTLDVPKVEGYVFRNGYGHEKVIAWSWGEAHESGYLTFAPASLLKVVDREGQATLVGDGGPGDADQTPGSVTIQLPAVPVDPDPTDNMRITAEPLIISKQ